MKILEYLSDKERLILKEHYREDQNSMPYSYVLDEKLNQSLAESDAPMAQVLEIFKNLCLRDDVDEDLCACFMPGLCLLKQLKIKYKNNDKFQEEKNIYIQGDSYKIKTRN